MLPKFPRRPFACLLVLFATAGARAQTLEDPALTFASYVSGLSQPTGFVFLPTPPEQPFELFACEKATGRVLYIVDGVIDSTVLDLPVNSFSERGLLGIALHPDFALNNWVYVYYTRSDTGDDSTGFSDTDGHRVERYTWDGTTLGMVTQILSLPSTPGPNHDGGVLLFGPDDKLYGVLGDLNRDGQNQNNADGPPPDDTSIIFRINDDGTAPGDNPLTSTQGMSRVYAFGVRNCFGLDFDPVAGDLWDTENGPNSYDEINRVLPGFNSGWNVIMGPDSLDSGNVTDLFNPANSHYSDPEFSWFSPIGVTSLHFIRNDVLGSHYEFDLIISNNNLGSLYHFELGPARGALVMPTPETQDRVANNSNERDTFLWASGFGVVTDVDTAEDGVYVLSYSSGIIYRIFRRATSDTVPGATTALQVRPNPTGGEVTISLTSDGEVLAGEVHARVFSAGGLRVRTLTGSAAGLTWDGHDDAGRTVPSGVYFVRVRMASERFEAKVTLTR